MTTPTWTPEQYKAAGKLIAAILNGASYEHAHGPAVLPMLQEIAPLFMPKQFVIHAGADIDIGKMPPGRIMAVKPMTEDVHLWLRDDARNLLDVLEQSDHPTKAKAVADAMERVRASLNGKPDGYPQWTKTPPSEPGFFWWHSGSTRRGAEVVELLRSSEDAPLKAWLFGRYDWNLDDDDMLRGMWWPVKLEPPR